MIKLSPYLQKGGYLIVIKVCKNQELKQSKPKSNPQNQNGKYLILQIIKLQREHMVNRVSSYFPKGGTQETKPN